MDILLTYVRVFLVGGIVCLLGQILINKTEMTSARILVTFLLLGLALEVIGVFKYLEEVGKTG
ncbi:MAG TPA: SpoVA/SpoVAEb family sporulation membrane protein, partial [Eubacteriales bacterium]|nr:SpoVA/SpoVAEb family sporulation membrane protein [Eubacteriales bacterium]